LFLDSLESRNNVKLFSKLGSLASEFNILLSKQTDPIIIVSGLNILSHYGKLISSFLDFIDIEEDSLPPLKVALSKRIISSVNTIIGELKNLSVKLSDKKSHINRQVNDLLFIRELVIDIRYKCRTAK